MSLSLHAHFQVIGHRDCSPCNTLLAIIYKEETMRQPLTDRTTPLRVSAVALLCAVAAAGCVSRQSHTKTLAELEAAKNAAAQLLQRLDEEGAQREAAEQQGA